MHERLGNPREGRPQRAKTGTAESQQTQQEREWRQRQAAPSTELQHHGVGDPGREEGAEAESGRKAIATEMRVKRIEQRDHG